MCAKTEKETSAKKDETEVKCESQEEETEEQECEPGKESIVN